MNKGNFLVQGYFQRIPARGNRNLAALTEVRRDTVFAADIVLHVMTA